MTRLLAALVALVGGAALSGCTSTPDLPPGLLDDIPFEPVDASSDDGGTIPYTLIGPNTGHAPGPYGDADGDTVRNHCFDSVWESPEAADYDTAAMERVCLANFYDPTGERGIRLLLLTTVAEWCSGCAAEWGGSAEFAPLSEEIKRRHAAGLRNLGLMYHDQGGDPAKLSDAVAWARAYEIDVPFGLVVDFLMGSFADANVQPFNMLVRTDTMQIVARFVGEQPANLFARIDQELSAAALRAADRVDAGSGATDAGDR
jgi:hypothetical protein